MSINLLKFFTVALTLITVTGCVSINENLTEKNQEVVSNGKININNNTVISLKIIDDKTSGDYQVSVHTKTYFEGFDPQYGFAVSRADRGRINLENLNYKFFADGELLNGREGVELVEWTSLSKSESAKLGHDVLLVYVIVKTKR